MIQVDTNLIQVDMIVRSVHVVTGRGVHCTMTEDNDRANDLSSVRVCTDRNDTGMMNLLPGRRANVCDPDGNNDPTTISPHNTYNITKTALNVHSQSSTFIDRGLTICAVR